MAIYKPEVTLNKLIANRFSNEELRDFCHDLNIDYENLSGATRSAKATSLLLYTKRHGPSIDELIFSLSQVHPDIDFQPYLYLLVQENFKSGDKMRSLCESFQLDCRKLLLESLRIHDWTSLPEYISNQSYILQEELKKAGRIGELVLAIRKANPHANLTVFERLIDQETINDGHDITDIQSPNDPKTAAASSRQFENFDLRVGRKGVDGRYPVEVTENPIQSEMYDPIYQTFPVDDYDFTDLISYLSGLVARQKDAKDLGKAMQQLLFPGEIWNIFYASLTRMKQEGKGLRIRLRVDSPELSQWPWEYCYYDHPDFGFFALDSSVPIIRYLPGAFESQNLTVPNPLKVLVVVSEPSDQKKLQVEKEVALIERILNLMGDRVQVRVLRQATYERIQGAFIDNPHIFHYIGHGDVQDGQGVLILEDRFGMSDFRDAEQMQIMLKNRGIKVAILNACKSASHNTHSAFSGMAPALIKAQIPAVIAMQFNVPDTTALSFALNLYRYLVSGYPLETAVTEMRKGAFNKDKYFWGIPVLYMRAPDGMLWQPEPELLALFDKAQREAGDISVDSPADLLGEIIKEINGLVENGKLSDRDARYVVRGLEEAQNQFNNESPDLDAVKRELERAIEDLHYSKSEDAITQVVPKVQHVLQQAK